MDIITIGLILFGFILSFIIHGNFVTPLGIFSSCWLFILGVHYFDFMGYYELSESTKECVLLMALFIMLGAFLAHLSVKEKIIISNRKEFSLYLYERYTTILLVYCAFGLIGFSLFLVLRPVDLNITTTYVRLSRSGEGLYRPIRDLIYSFSLPCLLATILVATTLHARLIIVAQNLKGHYTKTAKQIKLKLKIMIVLSISCLILYDILTLGRIYIFSTIIILIVSYFITTRTIGITLKYSVVMISILFGGIYLLTLITERREIAFGFEVVYSLLNYITAPLAYFNEIHESINYFELWRMTLGAFDSFFLRPFDYIPIIRDWIPPIPEALMERQVSVYIGQYNRSNAFGTFMLDGYYDAGIIGVSILSGLVGFISTYYYKKSVLSAPRILSLCTLSSVWMFWTPLSWAGGYHLLGTVIFWILFADCLAVSKLIKWSSKTNLPVE